MESSFDDWLRAPQASAMPTRSRGPNDLGDSGGLLVIALVAAVGFVLTDGVATSPISTA